MVTVDTKVSDENAESKAMEQPSLDFVVTDSARPSAMRYGVWFRKNVLRHRAFVWIVAGYLHWVLLLMMTMIAVHHPEAIEELRLTMGFEPFPVDTEPLELIVPMPLPDAPVASEFIPDAASMVAIEELKKELPSVDQDSEILPEDQMFPDAVSDLGLKEVPIAKGDVQQGQVKSRPQKGVRAPSDSIPRMPYGAITAGSFSVWTVPSNPKRWEPYTIIVQIRVPEDMDEYPLADLEGVVVGSDGYQKRIPGTLRGMLPVTNGFVRLQIPVVSADAEVKDIVFVKSRMLAEAQRLTIQF